MPPDPVASKLALSLIIPLRDEQESLARLLRSILDQTRMPDEIILVDAGSQDQTVALAHELTQNDKRFRIVEAGPAWPGKARNIGVKAATCDWIAFTDAGITLDPHWLQMLVDTAEQDLSVDVVYGSFEPKITTVLDRCAALTWVSPRSSRGDVVMRGPVIPSALIRKSVIEAVGGFPDFRATEDLIFMEKIEQGRYTIAWQPNAKIEWTLPATLSKTFARFRLYSRHNVYASRQRYWHYGVLRFYAATLAASLVMLAFLNWHWALLMLPMGLVARALKSIWTRRKEWPLLSLMNPLQFLLILVLLIVLDAATFAGWLEATLDRIFNRAFFAVTVPPPDKEKE